MKKLSLPPYHLFQYRDNNYAFDIESSAVMKLDGPAYDALALRLEGAGTETITSRLAATYGEETAQTVVRELAWLQQKGIFRGPVHGYTDQENEAYIQQLTRMRTSKIELYLAEACNLRCRYCYVDSHNALNNGLMPWEIAKQAVDLVFKRAGGADTVSITFFGGEPLLNKPMLRQVIKYSQEVGKEQSKEVHYSMTTNATLLDNEIIGYIRRYNFGLMISMDGPKEVHDHMRPMANGKGSFDKAARNVKQLMKRRRSVTVRCTLSNKCLDRIKIVEFLEDFGYTRIAMSRCSGKSDYIGPHDIGPKEVEILKQQDDYFVERLFKQLDAGERVRFNPWGSSLRYIHNKQERRMRCGVGRGCTTVGIDGNLYPCHRYVGMEKYILGHVSTGIDQKKFADYLRGYFETKKKCESCWAINICGGYCPWYVSSENGAFPVPEDWWCEEVRDWLEQGIWMYDTLRERYPDYLGQIVGEDLEPVLR